MKKFWKENKDLIILVFIWILASIAILILLCPQIDEMVQAETIITLVFVTIFYAIQTQKLVRQEKISLEEQKKKNLANFWEGRRRSDNRLDPSSHPVGNDQKSEGSASAGDP